MEKITESNRCEAAIDWAHEGGLVIGYGLPKWLTFEVYPAPDNKVIIDVLVSDKRHKIKVDLDRPIPKWLQFGKVECNFHVTTLGIKSMRGFPSRIEGDLIISFCSSLENFEYMPEVITGNITMFGTRAKTIDGFNHTLRKVRADMGALRKNIGGFDGYEFIDMVCGGPTNEKE